MDKQPRLEAGWPADLTGVHGGSVALQRCKSASRSDASLRGSVDNKNTNNNDNDDNDNSNNSEFNVNRLFRSLFRHSSSSSSTSSDASASTRDDEAKELTCCEQEAQPLFVVFEFSPGLRISLPLHSPANPLASSLSFMIWRSSLVAATRVARQETLDPGCSAEASWSAQLSANLLNCSGKKVLELGCGQALVGLLAGQLGASSVTLTDIRDEALLELQSQLQHCNAAAACGPQPASPFSDNQSSSRAPQHGQCCFQVMHLLWEQDRLALDHMDAPPTAEEAAASSAAREPALDRRQRKMHEAAAFAELHHWSSGCRAPSITALSPCEHYDLIIAADCLYFPCQEDGLSASLLLRMRRPHGTALVVFQPRNNNGACIIRLAEVLRAAGMHVLHEKGPWCHSRMAEEYLFAVPGYQGACQRGMDSPHRTANEQGEVELLTCAWAPMPTYPHGVECR